MGNASLPSSSTPENLQRAQRDFQNGIMGTLDGVPF
jgi:hypothetical protein